MQFAQILLGWLLQSVRAGEDLLHRHGLNVSQKSSRLNETEAKKLLND
jgi:hypothetical protein